MFCLVFPFRPTPVPPLPPSLLAHLKGMEDEICPYATFHLLGFREEMDPTKAMNFQTFPHQNGTATPGHTGTMGTGPSNAHMHSRSGSQSMVSLNWIASNAWPIHSTMKRHIPNLCFIFDLITHRTDMLVKIAKEVKVQFTHRHPNTMIQPIALKKINT